MNTALFAAFGISFSYPRGPKVLDEVSIEIDSGEIVALLGPNGCGKSTLMRIMAGILPLGSGGEGQIRHRGTDFLALESRERARTVAYVGYDLRAEFPLTAYETVMLGRVSTGGGLLQNWSPADREAVENAMNLARCWHLKDRDLHELSGGEKQKVALARALVQGAKILFLDESLAQMDMNVQAQMGEMLRGLARQGWSVLWVSHDVNLAAEFADSCVLMRAGQRLAAGSIANILTEAHISALYPGADLRMGANPITGTPKVFFGKR